MGRTHSTYIMIQLKRGSLPLPTRVVVLFVSNGNLKRMLNPVKSFMFLIVVYSDHVVVPVPRRR